jgi:hypothetical protein
VNLLFSAVAKPAGDPLSENSGDRRFQSFSIGIPEPTQGSDHQSLLEAKTVFTAEGFSRPASCHSAIQRSAAPSFGRSWLVMAITTTSGLVSAYLEHDPLG